MSGHEAAAGLIDNVLELAVCCRTPQIRLRCSPFEEWVGALEERFEAFPSVCTHDEFSPLICGLALVLVRRWDYVVLPVEASIDSPPV